MFRRISGFGALGQKYQTEVATPAAPVAAPASAPTAARRVILNRFPREISWRAVPASASSNSMWASPMSRRRR